MNTFRIPVSSIEETGYTLDARALVSEIQPGSTSTLPIDEVSISGQFVPLDDNYLFRGTVNGVFAEACYRCLAPAKQLVKVPVSWVFTKDTSGVYRELGHSSDDHELTASVHADNPPTVADLTEIDVAPYMWEELVLAQPTRIICNETCQGLCPRCGENLNLSSCTCQSVQEPEQPGNSGLAKLAQLFPEFDPNNKKE
ncbi:MAG: DUF177 domain-containing protein [Candidatus Hydrogenedentes bacterium]|jgi:uncharacterized metal-binding protein YceD (DUF177 family)|nr:DUF177 domain-containing protein [Candidatus Hydrogenedentota bacterium]